MTQGLYFNQRHSPVATLGFLLALLIMHVFYIFSPRSLQPRRCGLPVVHTRSGCWCVLSLSPSVSPPQLFTKEEPACEETCMQCGCLRDEKSIRNRGSINVESLLLSGAQT